MQDLNVKKIGPMVCWYSTVSKTKFQYDMRSVVKVVEFPPLPHLCEPMGVQSWMGVKDVDPALRLEFMKE